MAFFRPTAVLSRVTEIRPDLLSQINVSALLLDVDNTVAKYTSHEPIPGAVKWARDMEKAGFKLVIVSNNFKKRVSSFARKFGLPCVSFALKPFPFGYLKARKLLGVRRRDCAIVGDQIFTDVVGANLCGMKSILLSPIEPEDGITFKVRRLLESPLRRRFEKDQRIIQADK